MSVLVYIRVGVETPGWMFERIAHTFAWEV